MANELDNELIGVLSGASTLEGTLTIPERLTIQANKTITPTDSQQVVGPDDGYDGLAKVTVAAAPLDSTKYVTPSDTQQIIEPSEGKIGIRSVFVAAAPAAKIDFVMSSAVTTDIPSHMFDDQTQIKSFKTNMWWDRSIGSQAFDDCTGLERVEFPTVASIGSDAFYGCNHMKDYYFGYKSAGATAGADQVPTLASANAISGAQGFKIHVPADMEAYYKAASGWSNLASRIVGDYVIE